MSKIKDKILEVEAMENALEESMRLNMIFNDIFDINDLQNFYKAEINMVNGDFITFYEEDIEHISSTVIKIKRRTKIHKNSDVINVISLQTISVPHICHIKIFYEE